ncbi:MAG: ATP-dependent Clp protease proteolytic subunit [Methanobrevibacter sp.]|nr:ATP-dependent Clp protease proteolytic subunit [Methanobrevibacter sp.]
MNDNLNIFNVNVIGERSLYFSGEIDSNSIARTNCELLKMISKIIMQAKVIKNFEPGHINLFIESFGGSLDDSWALIDIILNSPIPIYTYALGMAESGGLKIFLAGDKRFVMEHSLLMFHELSACSEGKFADIHEYHEYLAKEQEKIDKYILERTKMKKKQLEEIKKSKEDFYMCPQEALDLGFATNMFSLDNWDDIVC